MRLEFWISIIQCTIVLRRDTIDRKRLKNIKLKRQTDSEVRVYERHSIKTILTSCDNGLCGLGVK